jgi:phosphoserine aminotransferase
MSSNPLSKIKRVHNFNAGPAALPLPVLLQAQAEMLDYNGCGMSVMEMSHRSKEFESIIQTTEADLRELLNIPQNYKVMFLQGGASLQFAMVPMNLRPAGGSADYIVNGSWGKTAFKEGGKAGTARLAATTESSNFNCLPGPSEINNDPKAAYLHFTSNETIHGVEWVLEPVPPAGVPLICDMSSDFVSRPVDVSKYSLIYAGAQKNAGPAGVVIVIIKDELLEKIPANLPVMLDYKVQAESGSLHNTPPCYAVYVTGLVMKWLKGLGGLSEIARLNGEKASLIYKAIDDSGGFYKGHAVKEARSKMNVTFRLPTEDLEKLFVSEAGQQELIGLKGHRSVGGLRASIYNAVTLDSVKALVQFMGDFQKKNG